jgi:hypothetical protein
MNAPAFSQLRSIVLRTLVIALLLAGTLVAAVSNAGAQEARASLTIRVHSCPDDLDATGFYQYGQRCTSTKGLFGVPLKFTFVDGTSSFLYSQPSGDETYALAMNLPTIPASTITVSEVVSTRVRESVVFCSLQPAGNQAPTMDGDEVPVVNGAMTLETANGDSVDCDWYRFPGGIASEDENEEASPVAHPEGGSIQIQKWICDVRDAARQADQPEAEVILDGLESTCAKSQEGFSFDLADDTEDGQDYPERTIGGQEADYMGWNGLVPAQYSISESLSGDFDEPIVLCEGNVPGRQTVRRNLVQLEAHHGGVSYDLEENETLTCEWFNVSKMGGNSGSSGTPTDQSDNGIGFDVGINDHDVDGIIDADEAQYGTDPNNEDTDGDGVRDGDEVTYGTDPLNSDTDGDGASDGDEIYNLGTDPLNVEPGPSQADADLDGLADGDEINIYGTDPNNPDTDFDGLGDSDEVIILGTDPNNEDTDGDGVSDPTEVFAGTDPLDPASN